MTPAAPPEAERRPPSLTVGSRVRVLSAGAEEAGLSSVGIYRGLVSIAGESALAIELDAVPGEPPRLRMITTSALWAVDILEWKAEEDRRTEKAGPTPEYFR
ncbi:MAG: hypothetical protein QXG65_06585 [Thermoplasmata archaeon]